MANKNYFYRDINETNPKIKPDVFDVSSIAQNITNIIMTPKGTRMFLPEFGVDLDSYLFELMDDVAALDILNAVFNAIRLFEPRVKIIASKSDIIPIPEENTFEISLFFEIQGFEGETFNVTESITR